MVTDTITPSLAAYRTRHTIVVDDSGPLPVCAIDGIRIHPTRVGGWFHDSTTTMRLHREEVRAMVRELYVSEIADDGLGQAKARDDIFENGRITVEWRGHALDVDVAE